MGSLATCAMEQARGRPRVPADLRRKHRRMAKDPFRFLRATFYRWTQYWSVEDQGLLDATPVLSVADLRVDCRREGPRTTRLRISKELTRRSPDWLARAAKHMAG